MGLRIAVVAGDGVGVEVTREALKVLKAVSDLEGVAYSTTDFPYGGGHYLKTGQVITDRQIDELRGFDAIMLGAVGRPDVKPGIIERELLLKLRFTFDQYINLRPVVLYEGVRTPLANKGPEDISFVVVRENTEDLYCGHGGTMRRGTSSEIATQEMITTRHGAERCLRYAFELCRQRKADGRGRGLLTLVHKTNVLVYCGDTWYRAFEEIGQSDYPDIQRNYHHVDACCMYMTTSPQIYDTIVTANMFGDIITDLGAAIAGGMGVAASGNINPDRNHSAPGPTPALGPAPAPGPAPGPGPGMFEPVHGSAPDIAGQNKANPVAAVLSLGMLLRETGRMTDNDQAVAAGERVEKAVAKVCPRFSGQSMDRLDQSTVQVGDMLAEAL